MTQTSPAAFEQITDPVDAFRARAHAAERLGLDPAAYYRVVAVPASDSLLGRTGVALTVAGKVRVAVRGLDEELPMTRAGIGLAFLPTSLDRSWASALLALRLTSRYSPVLNADDLGSLLLIAEAADAAPHDHKDLAALKFLLRAQPHALAVLEVLATTANIRLGAAQSGLHIETVRERAREYIDALGFDLLTSKGRSRLTIALALFRMQTNRFS